MNGRERGGSAVRITAGRWKGRRLEVPAGARPTSGRAREALFSILQETIGGARVLDLYAGSGAVGLEAVSRGAARAVLVERDASALIHNVERLVPEGREVRVLQIDVPEAIEELTRSGERFDIVFSDPPYDAPLETVLVPSIVEITTAGGLFVFQRDAPGETIREPDGLTLVRRREYGRNVFYFFAATATSLEVAWPEPRDSRGTPKSRRSRALTPKTRKC